MHGILSENSDCPGEWPPVGVQLFGRMIRVTGLAAETQDIAIPAGRIGTTADLAPDCGSGQNCDHPNVPPLRMMFSKNTLGNQMTRCTAFCRRTQIVPASAASRRATVCPDDFVTGVAVETQDMTIPDGRIRTTAGLCPDRGVRSKTPTSGCAASAHDVLQKYCWKSDD